MEAIWEILLDALLDTAKILPFLIVVYFLIEWLEWKKIMSFEHSKFLKGKMGPVYGALFGTIPQCGFSVASTDLYSKGAISVGTLIAVYVATSDEALPIMLSSPSSIPSLLLLIAVNLVMGIAFGYLADALFKKFFKSGKKVANLETEHDHDHEHDEHENHAHCEVGANESCEIGCCHHNLASQKFDWKHPILHSLKIAGFILAVNIAFGFLVYFVGEANLITFLSSSYFLQPLFAVLIGLIPNCASSVIITELYLMGGLSFGSIIAGLGANAGLGLLVLLKQNKNWKENLFIMLMLIVPCLIVGYLLHFLLPLLLTAI